MSGDNHQGNNHGAPIRWQQVPLWELPRETRLPYPMWCESQARTRCRKHNPFGTRQAEGALSTLLTIRVAALAHLA